MAQPLQIDGFHVGALLHAATNASYYAAQSSDGAAKMLVVFEQRRGLEPETQIKEFGTRARFEAAQWQLLRGHQRIAAPLTILRARPGLVYEQEGGIPLAQWLLAHPGPLSLSDALAFVLQLVDVLVFAHARGVLHRGLSPSVLWVDDAPVLKLRRIFGFGFANLLEPEQNWSRTGTMLGEVDWMAPEQFLGTELVPSTDLYAVGLLLYRLCTGSSAFEGGSVYQLIQAHCSEELPAPSSALGLSEDLRALLQCSTAKHPSQRFATAVAMQSALRGEAQRVTRAIPAVGETRPQHLPETGTWLAGDGVTRGVDIGSVASATLSVRDPLAHATLERPSENEQSFYAASQVTQERSWIPGHATSVNREAVLSARADDERKMTRRAPGKAADSSTRKEEVVSPARRRFPWRYLVGAWLLLMVIGVPATYLWRHLAEKQRDDTTLAREQRAASGGLATFAASCVWADEKPNLPQGVTTIRLSDERTILLSYEDEHVALRFSPASSEVLIDVPVGKQAAFYHRRFAVSQRDWLFFLAPPSAPAQPTLHALQFGEGQLLSANHLVLQSPSAELSLEAIDEECLLKVALAEPATSLRLRLVDPGLVIF